jgi:hypothetical protein
MMLVKYKKYITIEMIFGMNRFMDRRIVRKRLDLFSYKKNQKLDINHGR